MHFTPAMGQKAEFIGEATLAQPASANTEGAWTEITAGLTEPRDWVQLAIRHATDNILENHLIDIAFGAATEEQVVVNNIYSMEGSHGTGNGGHLPLYVPAGVRVAARYQGSTPAANACIVSMAGGIGGLRHYPGSQVSQTIGTSNGSSGGTQVDPGATANTKGAWTQLVASSARDARLVTLLIGRPQNAQDANTSWLVDLGIGPAASEDVLVENVRVAGSSGDDIPAMGILGPFPAIIPGGSRVVARASCSSTSSPNRLLGVAAILWS